MAYVMHGEELWDSSVRPEHLQDFYSPVYSESDGLMYWNETMGTDSSMKLTSTPDLDHDGNIAVPMPYCRPIYLDGGGSTILQVQV